jgi:excisionase family DNA binding protein
LFLTKKSALPFCGAYEGPPFTPGEGDVGHETIKKRSNDQKNESPADERRRMELLNIDAMAKVLGVSPKSVYRWVKLGKIPFIKLERHLRFQPLVVIEHFKTKTHLVPPTQPCFGSELLLQNLSTGRKGPRSLKIRDEEAAGSYPEKG